jgi:hypothetical protein
MKRSVLIIIGVLALAAPTQAAAETGSWLHVRVEETGAKPTTVNVNLPVSVIEQAAPLIQEKCVQNAKLKAGKKDFNKAQLQSLWNAVRAAEDGEFVTVESTEENVRVSKSGGYLLVRVRNNGKKSENVDVRVPLSVADALLSGPGDELDVMAAIHALAREGKGELVTVNDQSSVVRIWIDEKNTSK